MHKLTIEDDEGKTVVVPLIREEITVGRQEGNSIRLTERNISRRHARFFRQNGNLFVEDLGSYTGIKVSGARITAPTVLKDGDLVVIGDYKLTVRTDRPVATKLYGGIMPFTPGSGGGGGGGGHDAPRPLTLVPGINPVLAARNPSPPVQSLANPAPMPVQGSGAGMVTAVPLQSPGLAGATNTGFAASGVPAAKATPSELSATAPVPEATLDAAPTIPVRTLAEQGLTGDGPAPARLVVTATNLAGAEFALDRPSLVIGRTPENDIVLNHKSISRHHAKIIRDGEKYIVVDLESANGVRVNGAEFERVELQSGDTLELGHVRMKFTSGNEFVDFEVASGGSNQRRLMIFGAIGVVALAGIFLTFASSPNPATEPVVAAPKAAPSTGSPSTPPAGTAPTPVAADPATPPTGTAPPEPATPPPQLPTPTPVAPAVAGPDVDKLLTETKALVTRRKWDDAAEKVGKILAAAPTHAEAQQLKRTVEAEKATSLKFIRLEEAAKTRASYEEALQLFGEIPETSVYKARAQPIKDLTQKRFIALRLTEAEQFASRGECEEARHETDRVLALDPENERAKALPEKCDRLASQKIQREAEKAERATRAATAPAVVPAAAVPREVPATPKPVAVAPTPRPPAEPRPAARVPTTPEPRLAVAPPPRPPAEPRTPTPRPAAAEPAARAAPPETGDPDALLQESQQAWLRGQFASAIDSARRALRVRPNNPRAYQIIAVCSCSLRDGDAAAKAYERLDERMKPLVKSACQKSGIQLN